MGAKRSPRGELNLLEMPVTSIQKSMIDTTRDISNTRMMSTVSTHSERRWPGGGVWVLR